MNNENSLGRKRYDEDFKRPAVEVLKNKLQFADRLRSLRDDRGLNNLDLAKAVGLSHVSIGNFLNGQLPKSEHLLALADLFGVTTDWLLGRDGSTQPKMSEHFLTDVLSEMEALKERIQLLDRAVCRIKQNSKGKG
jgi:transcriptional regulator with XRE-family HTH domain